MNKLDMSIASFIIGSVLLLAAIIFDIQDKVEFAISIIGVYFILAGFASNKKLIEFLKG